MAAQLIKIVTAAGIREFSPTSVIKIEYLSGTTTVSIVLTGDNLIVLTAPSVGEALLKLGQLETAMSSGSGIVTVTDEVTTTTTTTSAPLLD
jgi:hypothetical protein